MKMEISVAEVRELINQIRQQPGKLFEMIRVNIQKTVGQYLSTLMDSELTDFWVENVMSAVLVKVIIARAPKPGNLH